MTLSTTGTPSNGIVYITMSGKDAQGNSILEQGSGILLSNDEVLTAAHLVYNPDGSLRTSGTAAVGYDMGASVATSKIDGVQVGPPQDYTSIAGMAEDFAVVHLSTKVSDGTIFSLGSGIASGVFQVSGYPVGMAGKLDTKTETLSVASGTQVYVGETLHDGGNNPNGSSGGSVYQIVNGTPVAYGVISAMSTSDTTKGLFTALTAADVAEIQAWVAGADAIAPQTSPLGSSTTAALAQTSAALSSAATNPTASTASTAATIEHSAPGFEAGLADILMSDAEAFSGVKHAAMVDVAAAITQACRDGGSFDAMAQDAAAYLYSTSSNAGRDVAYLAGLLSGTTDSWLSNLKDSANAIIDGSVFDRSTKAFAAIGRHEGMSMAVANTSAAIDQGSATLASVLSDAGHLGGMTSFATPFDGSRPSPMMASGHSDHFGRMFA